MKNFDYIRLLKAIGFVVGIVAVTFSVVYLVINNLSPMAMVVISSIGVLAVLSYYVYLVYQFMGPQPKDRCRYESNDTVFVMNNDGTREKGKITDIE